MKFFFLLSTLLVLWSKVSSQDNSTSTNTTVPIPKPPPIDPLPIAPIDPVPLPPVDPSPPSPIPPSPKPVPPKPKPIPPVVVITENIVTEAKVPTTTLAEYQRFGHSVASYGSTVAVGTSKESLSATVYKYTVEVTSTGPSSTYATGLNVTCSEHESVSTPVSGNEGNYYDGFGQSVALNAAFLMVAAPYRSTELTTTSSSGYSTGAVFAFSSSSSTSTTTEVLQRLVPSTPNANMLYGACLSLSQNTLVVGAPGANTMGQMSGAAYVYTYNNATELWEEVEVLMDDTGGAAFAQFGSSVFLSDDTTTLAVGASGYSKHAVHGGAVFLYQHHPTTTTTYTNNYNNNNSSVYTLQSILVPPIVHGYAYFGHTVYFRGPLGLVSAYDENGSGVVYLYEQSVPTTDTTDFSRATAYLCSDCFLRRAKVMSTHMTWALREVLRPLVPTPINQFGAALAIFHTTDAKYDGTAFLAEAYVVAVGAPGDVTTPTTTTTTTTTTSASTTGTATTTAMSSMQLFAGSVYLYLGPHNFTSASTNALVSSDKWTYLTKVLANDSSAYDAYGRSLSLMGAHLLVGAELANSNTIQKTGAVYLETNLIPYLVAAAQHTEDENNSTSDGSDNDTVWTQFLAFFTTSGGIVTMSFLPVAVLLVIFVAHSKTQGKPVLASALACKSRILYGPTHTHTVLDDKHHNTYTNKEDVTGDLQLSTVYDNTNTTLSPTHNGTTTTITTNHTSNTNTTTNIDSTDSTPTLWQKLHQFLRNPMQSTVHVPLATDNTISTESVHYNITPTNTATTATTAPTATTTTTTTNTGVVKSDLRVYHPSGDLGHTSAQVIEAGLSIRSPITHIPAHSYLVSSPPGRHASPRKVQSFRVEDRAVVPLDRAMVPLNSGSTDSAEENTMLLTPSEMTKLKAQLNSEFTSISTSASGSTTGNTTVQRTPTSMHLSGEKAVLTSTSKRHDDTHTVRV